MSNYLVRTWHDAEGLADQAGSAEAYGYAHAYRVAIDQFGTGPKEVSPEDILSGVLAIMADAQPVPYASGDALAYLEGFAKAIPPLTDHLRRHGRI